MISWLSNNWSRTVHLKSLFLYSTAAAKAAAPRNVMAEFLINSLGFTKKEAIAAAQKQRSSNSFRNDPNLVVVFLEKLGLDKPQIKNIVYAYPRVLLSDPQKSFEPKIKALQDIGLSGSNIITILTNYRSLLCRPLKSNILAPIQYLTSVLGSNELVCIAILRHCSLLHDSAINKLAPNITFLQKLGFSQKNLSILLIRNPRYLLREPQFLVDLVENVENKYKISRNAKMFFHVLTVLCSKHTSHIDKKFNVFRSFGWSEENIHVMFRNVPYIVGFSEVRLRKSLEFYIDELGFKPDYLSTHGVLLNFSLEKRVKPRLKIIKILLEKKLLDEKSSFYSGLILNDMDFIKRFILPYQDDVAMSITDLEFLKNYILLQKDEIDDLYG